MMSCIDYSRFDFDELDDFACLDHLDMFEDCVSSLPIYEGFAAGDYPNQCAVAVPLNDGDDYDNNDSTENCKKRKGTSQQMVAIKLQRPRILKRDIRRNFPLMWVNVFNSCDYGYMMQHLHTYYDPYILVEQRDLRSGDMQCYGDLKYMIPKSQGIPALAQFWYSAMNGAPDLTCELKHTRLKIRTDGTSVIQCCFSLSGTKIMPVPDENDSEAMNKLRMCEAAMERAKLKFSDTAAALAAVAPAKLHSVLRNPLSRRSSSNERGSGCIGTVSECSRDDSESLLSGGGDEDNISLSDVSLLDKFIDSDSALDQLHEKTTVDYIQAEGSNVHPSPTNNINNTKFSSKEKSISTVNCVSKHIQKKSSKTALIDDNRDKKTQRILNKGTTKNLRKTTGSKKQNSFMHLKGNTDWLSLSQEAYRSGAVETEHGSVGFYSSYTTNSSSSTSSSKDSKDNSSQRVSSGSSIGSNSISSVNGRSSRIATVSKAADSSTSVSVGADAIVDASADTGSWDHLQLGPVSTLSDKYVVIPHGMDSICSMEMNFSADYKIVSLVLNYLT